jgi:predicted lysophospholipase L1 biosynthesis ABC-type transport system permease subunit
MVEGARKLKIVTSVVIVEVAAVAVVNGVVHAALSNAVDFAVHWEVLQLHFRLKHALPEVGGHLSYRLGARA